MLQSQAEPRPPVGKHGLQRAPSLSRPRWLLFALLSCAVPWPLCLFTPTPPTTASQPWVHTSAPTPDSLEEASSWLSLCYVSSRGVLPPVAET